MMRRRMDRSGLRRGIWIALLCAVVMPGFAQPEKTPEPKMFIVPIHGPIYDITADFINRCLDDAVRVKAEVVVFEMDTPGGLVSSAKVITERIKSVQSVRTIAWVRPEAISAGAMISVACDEIVIAPSAMPGHVRRHHGGPTGGSGDGQDRAGENRFVHSGRIS